MIGDEALDPWIQAHGLFVSDDVLGERTEDPAAGRARRDHEPRHDPSRRRRIYPCSQPARRSRESPTCPRDRGEARETIGDAFASFSYASKDPGRDEPEEDRDEQAEADLARIPRHLL